MIQVRVKEFFQTEQDHLQLGTGGDSGHSHNMSATFTGDSTSVLQPYLAVIYIIKT